MSEQKFDPNPIIISGTVAGTKVIMTNLKKDILVVFNPYVKPGQIRPFRYRCISVNKLPEYIGAERSEKELQKFINSGLQKDNFYVKLCGKVYLYRK